MTITNYDKQHFDNILTQAIVSIQANIGLENIALRWGWTREGQLTILICKRLYVAEDVVIDQSENNE